MRIAITGGTGNLGMKLATALSDCDWCEAVTLLDQRPAESRPPKSRFVQCDLEDATDRRWIEPLAEAEAVVDLAVANLNPLCGWDEAARNVTMTTNIAARLTPATRRLVMASSIHALGGYMTRNPVPGALTPETPPLPGTQFHSHRTLLGPRFRIATAYGASKVTAEQSARALAHASDGRLSAVTLRIGLIARGDNHPMRIHLAKWRGAERHRDWYRKAWLSNRDFTGIALAALTADAGRWPSPAITINAISANAQSPWNIEATERLLGYRPIDDAFEELRRAGVS
ncbi:MAG: NAD(P)-dependent oxidoreductase [Devosia sp.]